MSTIPLSTSSTTPILLSDEPTSDSLNNEIMTYFISRGFQPSLVKSFLEREVHLNLKTNEQLMFDFLEEREQLDPVIFVGIEGSGVSGIESGEDERLLVKWGLTDEAARELRQSVRDDALWSQQILYHWLFDWITYPFVQMSFDEIFYNKQFTRNQWNSYDREDGPFMFASSYKDIIDIGIDGLLSNNTKVTSANSKSTTHQAFFHATNQRSAQDISENGIILSRGRANFDFGYTQSFYLNPSLDHAIEWIKKHKGFNGIVVYWVDIDKIKSMSYRDLDSEIEDFWREVVVASRCRRPSAVDNNEFVYGYMLSNPRQILNEWVNYNNRSKDSWKQFIPRAKWFEPIRHHLAIKTVRAAQLIDSYRIGVIYFHNK